MKTIRCNLIKHVGFSQLSHNHYVRLWGYFLKKIQEITPIYRRMSNELFTGDGIMSIAVSFSLRFAENMLNMS